MTDKIGRGVAREYYYNTRHEKSVATLSIKSVVFLRLWHYHDSPNCCWYYHHT